MAEDNELTRLMLSKQDAILDKVSKIEQFMAAQNEKNKRIEGNEADIKELKEEVGELSTSVKILNNFRAEFKEVVFEVMRAPLAAFGFSIFVVIGLVLWIWK